MSNGQSKLRVVPCELADANAFVDVHHRHHKRVPGHRWSLAVEDEASVVRGIATVGRPTARMTDQRRVVEVLRVATDGCPNACSSLYGGACRQQKAHGYDKAITFTLITEPGTSLVAAGWRPVAISAGGEWDRPSRKRERERHPTIPKIRWECRCSTTPAIELRPLHERCDHVGSVPRHGVLIPVVVTDLPSVPVADRVLHVAHTDTSVQGQGDEGVPERVGPESGDATD